MDGIDLRSQSPPSSEMLLESQMVSIEAGKKNARYRKIIFFNYLFIF